MSPVLVRRASAADLDFLAQNHNAMAMETEGRALDPAKTIPGTRAVLEDATKGFYLVAERDGERVGQLLITYEWSDWRNGTFWWIQSVFVVPNARRTGVYRALYDHVLGEARKDPSICGVRLYVETNNTRAQSTYRAMGMQKAHYELYEVDFVLGSG